MAFGSVTAYDRGLCENSKSLQSAEDFSHNATGMVMKDIASHLRSSGWVGP